MNLALQQVEYDLFQDISACLFSNRDSLATPLNGLIMLTLTLRTCVGVMVNHHAAFGFAVESASAGQGILDDVSESPRPIDGWSLTTFGALVSRVRGDFFTGRLHTRLDDRCEQRGVRHRGHKTCSHSAIESDHGRAGSTDHSDLECEQCAELRGVRWMERLPTDEWDAVVYSDGAGHQLHPHVQWRRRLSFGVGASRGDRTVTAIGDADGVTDNSC
jgi:hypothetical protein